MGRHDRGPRPLLTRREHHVAWYALPSDTKEIRMSRYSKFIASLAGPILTTLIAALTDGVITGNEWKAIGATLIGSLAVYLAPPNDYSGQAAARRL